MHRSLVFLFVLLLSQTHLFAQNAAPVIQNLSAAVNWSNHTLTVQYDVSDAENDPLDISLAFSNNGGKTYALTSMVPVSGDIGFPVLPGSGHTITGDLSGLNPSGATFTVRIVADDRQPLNLQDLVDAVDSNRLRADLTFLQGRRHRVANLPHLNAVHDSIGQLFAQAGLYSADHTFAYGNYTGRNITGTASGVAVPDSVVIVDAHYDTVSQAPGADDNGSGMVGVMEIARLLSQYPSRKTLRFIGFDLEEEGVVGSAQYVSGGFLPGEKLAGVFNFEMIGYYTEQPNTQGIPTGFNLLFPAAYNQIAADQFRGNSIINVGISTYASLADLFSTNAATYVPDLKVVNVVMSKSFPVGDLLRSDHAPFWSANLPALMLTDGAEYRNKCYHAACDTLDRLNFTYMSNVVKATLASAARLAEVQHGDWTTTTFAGIVPTGQAWSDCSVSAAAYPDARHRIGLFFTGCPLSNLSLELFDAQGRLLRREALNAPPEQGWYEMTGPDLDAGVYFVRIGAGPAGSRTLKVLLY